MRRDGCPEDSKTLSKKIKLKKKKKEQLFQAKDKREATVTGRPYLHLRGHCWGQGCHPSERKTEKPWAVFFGEALFSAKLLRCSEGRC